MTQACSGICGLTCPHFGKLGSKVRTAEPDRSTMKLSMARTGMVLQDYLKISVGM
jgi:hypothetical protein